MPRVVYTDPQAAAVGATDAPVQRDGAVAAVAKTATYSRDYADDNGFLTLLSDGERLTGAYALGPEAGEWLQQATLADPRHACRSTCCATRSSPSPPSRRSTSTR